ncbi:DUF1501 domain-containing protein [Blastopirellula marina]|uniref:DUF1501 domain-containing protein n=1 Tax=Blastopirellula marina TaxID=124 RepID=A0A2S8F0Z0_9BACT|nr:MULTISPECIES: DUF1501 domain-containing protein [Pirellulaceae]PQO25809.1 DUF1501 domain-containing protein [Blastopirellula marina]RCS43492.1 DUF1501 domain-containing protein [Bremerella cremea]
MFRPHSPVEPVINWLDRRRFLSNAASGLGAIALASLFGQEGMLAADDQTIDPSRPYQPRSSHFPPKAKNVIVIFCAGGVSHLDTWDYKPELEKRDGKPMENGPAVTFQGPAGNLARPQYKFRPRGNTGKMVSDMLPHLAELTDDLTFIHSLTSKSNTHGPAENFLSTGSVLDGFPSLGAWVTYALGCETQELPAYVAIPDPRGVPQNGSNNWGPGFLPAAFQGTTFSATRPIHHLEPSGVSAAKDDASRQFLARMNQRHMEENPHDSKLAARIASYELAARMQLSIPNVMNLESEPEHILKLYGADSPDKTKAAFARNCILARRLVERGVRFVQLFNGAYASGGELNWDGHNKLKQQYDKHAHILDQPAAGLIKDLKQRGMLEDTLVVWCTEFGRMPMFQKGSQGRDHNPDGFTSWMTGAGVMPGISHGATDELGKTAVQDVHPLYDFNATILHLLGLDHERLTVRHNGIDRRLTNVEGHIIHEILG